MKVSKQIRVFEDLKEFLDSKKKIENETYDNVIRRLVKFKGDK